MGDWVKGQLSQIVNQRNITGKVIDEYRIRIPNGRAIVFCVGVNHSKDVAKQFNEAGVPAVHVDGGTPKHERTESIQGFVRGDLKVLCNCELFGEGFDVPAIEAAILLRPTQSLGLYLQQVGRALRPSGTGREAIILDHVGNAARHGLLPHWPVEWSLDGLPKRNKRNEVSSVRICEACFAANKRGVNSCFHCGVPFQPDPREISERDGQLLEIELEQERKRRRVDQGMAKSMEDLIALGRARGYKNPRGWAWFVYNGRKNKHG
jgi:superfamily II DNA or RNA helicase